MELHNEIMNLLKKYSKTEIYINPNFLIDIRDILYSYYDEDDDEVNDWIERMFEE